MCAPSPDWSSSSHELFLHGPYNPLHQNYFYLLYSFALELRLSFWESNQGVVFITCNPVCLKLLSFFGLSCCFSCSFFHCLLCRCFGCKYSSIFTMLGGDWGTEWWMHCLLFDQWECGWQVGLWGGLLHLCPHMSHIVPHGSTSDRELHTGTELLGITHDS